MVVRTTATDSRDRGIHDGCEHMKTDCPYVGPTEHHHDKQSRSVKSIGKVSCRRCGHSWNSRSTNPAKCPGCQSTRWREAVLRFQCCRCGHSWNSRSEHTLSDVTMCPRCKSYKWISPIGVVPCSSCKRLFTTKSKKSRVRCPECLGRHSYDCNCSFCGSKWVSEDHQWKACPVCGSSSKQAWSSTDREVWSDGVRTIRYVPADEFVIFYLWVGGKPVSVCHESNVLEYLDVSSRALRLRFKDQYYDKMWTFLADCMYAWKDKCLHDIPRLMDKYGLRREDAHILALHLAGMSREAIVIMTGSGFPQVMVSLERIVSAFNDSVRRKYDSPSE